LKRNFFGGFGGRNTEICNDRKVFGRFEKRNKDNRVEDDGVRE